MATGIPVDWVYDAMTDGYILPDGTVLNDCDQIRERAQSWVDVSEDEFIPTEPELLPPKEETEEERNQRIWEAIQQVSQG